MFRSKAGLALIVFAAGASGWLALVLWGPVLPSPVAALVYGIGSIICHQRPERSFHWAGAQLPVCARCTGIYAGGVLALAAMAWPPRGRARLWESPASTRALLVAGAVPTIVTVAFEWMAWWYPGNVLRAVAGAPLGLALALVVVVALSTLHYRECLPRAAAPPPRPSIRI